MSDHTPGPWIFDSLTYSNKTGSTAWLTRLKGYGLRLGFGAAPIVQARADASLIAAAPDLLKHLRLAAIELAGWIECEEVPQHIAEEMSARLVASTAVLTAIDAARGGDQ